MVKTLFEFKHKKLLRLVICWELKINKGVF